MMLIKTVKNEQYSLKELSPSDWQTFKEIRLRALTNNPSVFSPKENEFERPDSSWIELLENTTDFQAFGLYHNQRVIGLTGIFRDREDTSGKTALLVMSYIDKEYRNLGLSSLFYEGRINWAKRDGSFKRIKVSHREKNEASRRANQRYGFVFSDKEIITWPDNCEDYIHNYYLEL